MNHIPVKKGKHLIVLQFNNIVPDSAIKKMQELISEKVDEEFTFLVSQNNCELTVITIED